MRKVDQFEVCSDVVLSLLFTVNNHEGRIDVMVLLADMVHNDLICYLTIKLRFWHELAWFLTLKLLIRYKRPMQPHSADLRDTVHAAATWSRGGRQASHP